MRKAFLALLLAASVTGANLTPLFAQDKTVNLKVSLWVPPAHPLVPATQAWAADIEKASGGTIKVTVFPSEQLGKAFDHYDMARDGIADVTYVNPGYQPGRFPIIGAGELPFLMANAKGGSSALDAWYRKYATAEKSSGATAAAPTITPENLKYKLFERTSNNPTNDASTV